MKFKNKNDFSDSTPLGALLFIFHKNQHKYINNKLSDYGLNINQALFLIRIYGSIDLTQNDLADIFYLTKGSVAKSLRKLEEDEFIIRERLDEDRRKYVLKLSKKGLDMIPIIQNINKDWENQMGLKDLNPQFMETFKDLTSKAIDLNKKI